MSKKASAFAAGLARTKDNINRQNKSMEMFGRSVGQETLLELDPNDIAPNPWQPRKKAITVESVSDLAQNISEQGLLQPIVVCTSPSGTDAPYTLIAGERRLRAVQLLQKKLKTRTITARLTHIPHDELAESMILKAVSENDQREDLTFYEKGGSYKEALSELDLSIGKLATKLGRSKSSISDAVQAFDIGLEDISSLEFRTLRKLFGTDLRKVKKAELVKALEDYRNGREDLPERPVNATAAPKKSSLFSFSNLARSLRKYDVNYKVRGNQITITVDDNDQLAEVKRLLKT